MAKALYARLFPYAPRQGFTMQRYTYKSQTYVGGERPTWYKVTKEQADELRELLQDETDPRSRPLFDIKTEEDKEHTSKVETDKYLVAMGATATTVDVNPPRTTDLRPPEAEEAKPKKKSRKRGGRAAAMPPPREPASEDTGTASLGGAITTGDVPKGNPSTDEPASG